MVVCFGQSGQQMTYSYLVVTASLGQLPTRPSAAAVELTMPGCQCSISKCQIANG